MELKRLFTEDRGVSPVIAVVLMIAVTVILAAIVAAFALGMGTGTSSTPQASFDYRVNASGGAPVVTITDVGGDSLDATKVTVLVEGKNGDTQFADTSTKVTTGTSLDLSQYDSGTNLASGDQIRIVWEGDQGKTSTLSTFTIP